MKTPLKDNHTKIERQIKKRIPLSQIANEYNVSRSAVYWYVNKHFRDLLDIGDCLECGATLAHRRMGSKFCSKRCSTKHYKRGRKPRYDVTCERCGKIVKKINNVKYCSTACALAAITKLDANVIFQRYKAGESIKEIAISLDSTQGSLFTCLYRAGIKLKGQLEKTCPQCGKQFGGTHSKKFCTTKCQEEPK